MIFLKNWSISLLGLKAMLTSSLQNYSSELLSCYCKTININMATSARYRQVQSEPPTTTSLVSPGIFELTLNFFIYKTPFELYLTIYFEHVIKGTKHSFHPMIVPEKPVSFVSKNGHGNVPHT